jgi:hypothetical protein
VFTPEQKQLDRMANSVFCDSILQILIEHYPEDAAVLNSADTKQVIREQVAKAEYYGIETELDVGRYVLTAWLMGRDFDTKFPTMNTILVSVTATAAQKMDAIEQIAESIFNTLAED